MRTSIGLTPSAWPLRTSIGLTPSAWPLHGPLDQPGHEVLIYEGLSHEAFILPALHRDIVRAHAWIMTPAGERLEDGPLTREGGTWFYPLQHPYNPAMQDIISFAVVVGPHHVNA